MTHEVHLEDETGHGTSRRRFLAGAAGLTGAALASRVLSGSEQAFAAPTDRSYSDEYYFGLELDGAMSGFLKSVDGGAITGEIVEEESGTYYRTKRIGQIRYEDFVVRFGMSMGMGLWDWISSVWAGDHERRDGAVTAYDVNYNPRTRDEFSDALLTETTIPALDASSKETLYLSARITPELIRRVSPDLSPDPRRSTAKPPPPALLSSFRLDIPGLDCTGVSRIEALPVRVVTNQDEGGEVRDPVKESLIAFPDLVVTIAASDAESWIRWHDDFVVRGRNADANENAGKLELWTSTWSEVLAEIQFFGLGISKITPNMREARSTAPAEVTASMYCERMDFRRLPSPA